MSGDRLKAKLRALLQRGRPKQRLKHAVHQAGCMWKTATSKGYRQAMARLKQQQRCYGMAEPLVGSRRILIICEASIPQCFKYRVAQRQEALALLGVQCNWVPWQDTIGCLNALQHHEAVIFYRTPLFAAVQQVLDEARRLRMPVHWEVDDLIFDADVLRATPTLQQLDWRTFRGLIKGARLYRNALLAADRGIASTECLGAAMQAAAGVPVTVIHNALDRETRELSTSLATIQATTQQQAKRALRIGYGSGTNTHNLDFLEASEALLEVLRESPDTILRIIGDLQLPKQFDAVEDQIERHKGTSYEHYLRLLADCDINLAPLESSTFNDCKSNIKWIEAAALGIPSVCSARAEFCHAINHGVNGLLCNNKHEWRMALRLLLDDEGLRQRMGQAAKTSAMERYSSEQIADREVRGWLTRNSVLNLPALNKQNTPKVLSLNVYYAPQSFGGATLVAEHLNQELLATGSAEIAVFCVIPDAVAGGKALHRYSPGELQVFGVPAHLTMQGSRGDAESSSEAVIQGFEQVLACFKPDLIHVHCIQGIGLGVLDLAREQNIPYIITLHDAWWLCARQFMLTPEGNYCGQHKIDPAVCAACTQQPNWVDQRSESMRNALDNAKVLLAPSQFFLELYKANGFRNVRLNRNGVAPSKGIDPSDLEAGQLTAGKNIRFGYLGGNVAVKGFDLVQLAFRQLSKQQELELVLVDNAMNLGFPSYFAVDLLGMGNVRVMPGFAPDAADSFYGQIDVLLFPTRWKESFGLAIREALQRGIWVITSDAGGTVEDLVDGVNGRVIPFGDAGEALFAAILEAKERVEAWRADPQLRPSTRVRHYGEQAKELAGVIKAVTGAGQEP